jgi:hypothetical protein
MTGATLEHTPRKSLKHLAKETGVSKSSARMGTQLLKLQPYKTTVINALQLHNPASRSHFCNWFLQSVMECEINLQLTFFSDEAWFPYWSLQNPHLTHKVLLYPVKIGGRIVVPAFFNETINCERQHFQRLL